VEPFKERSLGRKNKEPLTNHLREEPLLKEGSPTKTIWFLQEGNEGYPKAFLKERRHQRLLRRLKNIETLKVSKRLFKNRILVKVAWFKRSNVCIIR